mmetsp:Transcript_6362/g.13592  ORF Transcript_6362/g.13592 Transcript_6362/m.13592 type:complete len:129 (-) Transcript_6362:1073-1459(-)
MYHTKNDLTHLLDVTSTPQQKYHLDPQALSTGFVTIDGSFFVLMDFGSQSEKHFCTTVNKIIGSSTFDFCNWYTCFTSHCSCFGKYCHPYPSFQPTCPHPRGFTLGPNKDNNLSSTFETKIVLDTRVI